MAIPLPHLGILTRGRFSIRTCPTVGDLTEATDLTGTVQLEPTLNCEVSVETASGCVQVLDCCGPEEGCDTMASTLKLTKGNRIVLRFKLLDGCRLIENLAAATRIVFAVKKRKTDTADKAIVFFEWLLGLPHPQITIDDPATGYVRVVLNSSDMEFTGTYYFALQVEWGSEAKVEWTFTETGQLVVKQDMIA